MSIAYSGEMVAADESGDTAAVLLLKEVEQLLMIGQPRQAIAYICEVTGVERALAEQFVEELKQKLF